MITFIKNYIFAKKVCGKYGAAFKVCLDVDKSSARGKTTALDGELSEINIMCNPFSENFLEVFLHEVGHIVDFKQKKFYNTHKSRRFSGIINNITFNNLPAEGVISDEYLASRFSVRAMKSLKRYNHRRGLKLNKAMSSYLEYVRIAKEKGLINLEDYISVCHKAYRMINH